MLDNVRRFELHGRVAKKQRARTDRRERERAAKQIVADRKKLAAMVTGGSPENPFVVDTSAVIDGRARSQRCPLCDSELQWQEQTAERINGEILRATHMICTRCHAPTVFWFRIVASAPN